MINNTISSLENLHFKNCHAFNSSNFDNKKYLKYM